MNISTRCTSIWNIACVDGDHRARGVTNYRRNSVWRAREPFSVQIWRDSVTFSFFSSLFYEGFYSPLAVNLWPRRWFLKPHNGAVQKLNHALLKYLTATQRIHHIRVKIITYRNGYSFFNVEIDSAHLRHFESRIAELRRYLRRSKIVSCFKIKYYVP